MGFNKRNISKENILFHLKNEDLTSLVRQMKINTLFHSEMLVMDQWTSNFYNDLNPKEREIRKELSEKYCFDSGHAFLNDDDFKELKSLSETLLSLINEPLWIDIFITTRRLKVEILPDESGKFDLIKKKCIDALINHFDRK